MSATEIQADGAASSTRKTVVEDMQEILGDAEEIHERADHIMEYVDPRNSREVGEDRPVEPGLCGQLELLKHYQDAALAALRDTARVLGIE